jgi:thiosulfate/3-mercaptopyruvate sulfurtransferase
MNNRFLLTIYLILYFSSLTSLELPGSVVNVNWLKDHAHEVQIVNVRVDLKNLYLEPKFSIDSETKKRFFQQIGGHIENSLILDYSQARNERIIDGKEARFLIPLQEKFNQYIQNAGINNDKPIIIVSQGDSASDIFRALRLFWEFKVYGQKDIALLNGGMAAWLNQNLPYVTDPITPIKGNWQAKNIDRSLIANTEEVKILSDKLVSKNIKENNQDTLLLDARVPAQFFGISKRPYIKKFGHIPGALDYSSDLMFYSEKNVYYLLEKNTLKAIFNQMNLDTNQTSIVYCNTGEMAAGLWFILTQIFQNKYVKLYDGSFWLWINDDML